MTARIGTVVASVSRKAGGLFESVRNLTFAVIDRTRFDNVVFSLRDEYTDLDLPEWSPLDTKVCEVRGPHAFGFSPGLYRKLLDAKIDVVHNHGIWMYPSVAVSRLARARSVPYVVSLHGMLDPWAVSNSRWKKALADVVYERGHLRGAACLRALSESEAHAIRTYGLKNPICIVPNGIHLPPDERPSRPAWHDRIPKGRKVLLYLGRIHPKKGLRYLLHAWARLAAENPTRLGEWHLVIAGWDQGGHEGVLKALAAELGIADSVAFVGAQFGDDRRSTYAHSDAFILPSLGEGMPMVVLEAWSYRLPVVMTPQCNLGEGFEAGAALRVDPAAESIAAGLEVLFTLPEEERARMGASGRRLAEARYSWHNVGAEMGRVYDWILGAGSPPPGLWR